jgi:hypothetical protein
MWTHSLQNTFLNMCCHSGMERATPVLAGGCRQSYPARVTRHPLPLPNPPSPPPSPSPTPLPSPSPWRVTTTRMRSQRQPAAPAHGERASSRKCGIGCQLSRSNDELTALIVQGYCISSDSAVRAGQTVEKNTGRRRAAFIEKYGGRVYY